MHVICIVNSGSYQLIAMIDSNHFKYFHQPNLNRAE